MVIFSRRFGIGLCVESRDCGHVPLKVHDVLFLGIDFYDVLGRGLSAGWKKLYLNLLSMRQVQ